MSENMMCPNHKDNKKYRDKFDDIFRKKKKDVKKTDVKENKSK